MSSQFNQNNGPVADAEVLRKAVLTKQSNLRQDAPRERLTQTTFQATSSILDWASRGDLARSVQAYNNGGSVNQVSGEFVHREYYLMRIYDAAETLGRAQFERFVPGVWDAFLAVYRMTFSLKIVPAQEPAELVSPASVDSAYEESPAR